MRAALRPLTPADAAAIAAWTYPPPFDLYDSTGSADDYEPPDGDGFGYWVIDAEGRADSDVPLGAAGPLAFVCVGPEGRVPGQVDEPGTLDVGMGVRPDVVSTGVASRLVPEIVDAVRDRWSPERVRTAVAAFNDRSLRLCRSAGLRERRRFTGPGEREFVELVADVATMPSAR